jgi:hypothetical protein
MMMKKALLVAVCVCMACTTVKAALVEAVQVVFAGGVSSQYTEATGTIEWSGGASGTAITDSFNVHNFDQATVTATITNRTSPAASTSATFTTMNWLISLSHTVDPIMVDIAGTLKTGFDWSENIPGPDFLVGSGIVTVDSFTIAVAGVTAWKGGLNDTAGMQFNTTFPTGTGPVDFSADYFTDNATVILSADETVIPEPVTMTLLAMGAIGLIRRRKV